GRLTGSKNLLLPTMHHYVRFLLFIGLPGIAERRGRESLRLAAEADPGTVGYGEAIHHGHLLLGRIAWIRGDSETAVRELHEAGRAPKGPALETFGPGLRLAQDLLAAGRADAVLEYLELCASFWTHGSEFIAYWKHEIRGGRRPNLAADLGRLS